LEELVYHLRYLARIKLKGAPGTPSTVASAASHAGTAVLARGGGLVDFDGHTTSTLQFWLNIKIRKRVEKKFRNTNQMTRVGKHLQDFSR